ncbi:MAG: hypothetical protein ACKPKO_59035, partial [Candidatus Fonsibacter sp.]
MRHFGDSQFTEWVTATTPRPGVDALMRPTGDLGKRAGGIVRMTVRRVVVDASVPQNELLKVKNGVPVAAACLIPNVSILAGALATDLAATHRFAPRSMHSL